MREDVVQLTGAAGCMVTVARSLSTPRTTHVTQLSETVIMQQNISLGYSAKLHFQEFLLFYGTFLSFQRDVNADIL